MHFSRAESTSAENSWFGQAVEFHKGSYRLSLRYRTDGKLAPKILICAPNFDPRPLGIIRLPAATEWTNFQTDFLGPTYQDKPPVEVRIYPGTIDQPRLAENTAAPLASHTGKAEFSDLRLEEIPTLGGQPGRGPLAVHTKETIFKTAGDLPLKLFVDQPEGQTAPQPVIIWLFGGGWVGGKPESMQTHAYYFASRGVAGVRPRYRVLSEGGNINTTVEDVLDSVQWVKAHAAEYHFDPGRIYLAGFSAGAHLAALAAQKMPNCAGVIGLAGLYDFVGKGDGSAGRNPQFFQGDDLAARDKASPLHHLRVPPPPAFLIHGEMDTAIDFRQSLRFAEAIRAKSGTAEVFIVPGLNHAPLILKDLYEKMESFIRSKD